MVFSKIVIDTVASSSLIILLLKMSADRIMRSTSIEKSLENNFERLMRIFFDIIASYMYILFIFASIFVLINSTNSEKSSSKNFEWWQLLLVLAILWVCLFLGMKSILGIKIFLPRKTYYIKDGYKYTIEKTLKNDFILLSKRIENKTTYSIIQYEDLKDQDIKTESTKDAQIARGKVFKTLIDSLSKPAKAAVVIFLLVYIFFMWRISGLATTIAPFLIIIGVFFWYKWHINVYQEFAEKEKS